MGSLGGNLLVDDLEAVARADDLYNRYGLDTISVGQVIGFAFEAWERGFVNSSDTEGLSLEWGDPRAFASIALGYLTSPRGACHLQAYSHGVEAWLAMPERVLSGPIGRHLPAMREEYHRLRGSTWT